MRPKTSVRQPIIAGARRQHLSELLRQWRQQPRKRAPLLFWTLLSLALLSDGGLFFFAFRSPKTQESSLPLPAQRRIPVPYARDAALWEPLRHAAVRVDGRTRLFESFCREAVRRITGEERFEGRDPLAVVVSWMLDDGTNAVQWETYPFLRCEDAELRALLYEEGTGSSRLTREEQLHGRYVEPTTVRAASIIQTTAVERKLAELQDRLMLFERIRGGCLDRRASLQTARSELSEAYHSGDKNLFAAALTDYVSASQRTLGIEKNPDERRRLAWESWLLEYTPARYALYSSLLAAGLLVAAALRRRGHRLFRLAGLLACLGCLAWSAAALFGQTIRDGTPVGDGSQVVLWLAVGVMGMGLLLAMFLREESLARAGALVSVFGFLAANYWPLALGESHLHPAGGIAGQDNLHVQVLILLAAYAALALSWGAAAHALARVLLSAPSNEYLYKRSVLCLWPFRIGVALLSAGAFLYGCQILQQGFVWNGWNAQAVSTLLVLPGCAAVLFARRRGWLPPFRLLASVVLGFALLAVIWYCRLSARSGDPYAGSSFAGDTAIYVAGLISLSLTTHAAIRYYFGEKRIFAV